MIKPKIVDVITKILEGLSNNKSLEEVNKALASNKEFDKQTLGIAFSLLYDKILLKKKSRKKGKARSLRILSEEEKDILGIENYNYLMHLINLGLLDHENLETILEQVTIYPENKLTRKEINWIILISLVDFESEVLPGSRVHLFSSDSVN